MTSADKETSGFTSNLGQEIERDITSLTSSRFSDISRFYTSRTGPSILFTASRYGKRYTLKGLKEEFRYNLVYRIALQKEFEIGIRMDHPNVVRTIGFEEVENIGPVIVMEYIDGVTLESLISEKKISLRKVRVIARQLADALHYIHSKQIIHRDLKPSNIMVSHFGDNVRLIDFSLSDSETYTVLKVQAGTRSYMAPELNNPSARSNTATDIYSYGLILQELANLTGDRKLLAASRQCTMSDPRQRVREISELKLPSPSDAADSVTMFSIDSPKLTIFLIIIAIILSLLLIRLHTIP